MFWTVKGDDNAQFEWEIFTQDLAKGQNCPARTALAPGKW